MFGNNVSPELTMKELMLPVTGRVPAGKITLAGPWIKSNNRPVMTVSWVMGFIHFGIFNAIVNCHFPHSLKQVFFDDIAINVKTKLTCHIWLAKVFPNPIFRVLIKPQYSGFKSGGRMTFCRITEMSQRWKIWRKLVNIWLFMKYRILY